MFSPDLIAIIDILGAAHGLFLAMLLVSRHQNTLANRILAVAMVAFSIDLLAAAYFARGFQFLYPHFMGVDYLLPFLYGPTLYLYTHVVSQGTKSLQFNHLMHFIPFVGALLFMLPFYLQSGAEKLALYLEPEVHPWTDTLFRLNDIKPFYALIYLLMIFVLLHRHRKNLENNFSSLDKINLAWLQYILIGGLVTWAVSIFFQYFWADPAVAEVQDPLSRNANYVSIALACFVYAIGYLGLRQPEIFSRGNPVALPAVNSDAAPDSTRPEETPRYAKSGMDEARAETLKRRLLESMEQEKLYRRSTLTLGELADALDISPHNISEVLNTQIQKTFHDFVNGYRVEEVKHRLAYPANESFTLLAIGLDAGFNSKSSFNAVFKKHTGMTPSQFKLKTFSSQKSKTKR